MKEKLYIVRHIYDVDGGFGDAISNENVVGVVRCTEEEIKNFENKYGKTEVYDVPYADLTCHTIFIDEINPISITELEKDPYGDNGRFQRMIDDFNGMVDEDE